MKKKIFIPIIIAVVAVALIAIVAISIYTGKYGKNAPVLEVKEDVTVMEYSTVHIDEFIINTENVSSVRIADMKVMQNVSTGASGISENGQYVWIGDWSESYIVTIEATGNNGWKVRSNVKLYSYQEPPVYASEEERFLAEMDAVEGDYTHEETREMKWDEYFVVDKDLTTLESLYFKDAESFLNAYGFDVSEPFYKVYAEGDLVLTLYYDTETELACAIGSRGDRGACFQGVTDAEWNGYLWGDYMDPVVIYVDERLRPEDYMGDYHYDEIKEYDESGRLVEYRVTNVDDYVEEISSYAKDSYDGWNDALKVSYEYQANGELAYREYFHNSYIFGTTQSSLQTWFDEQGRPVYECAYITHGCLEWFYIYEDEDEIPEYVLSLDMGWGTPEFTRYE